MTILRSYYKNPFLILTVALLLLPLIDYIYLSTIASSIYGNAIANIQGSPMKLRLGYAVGAYFFLALGLYYFLLRDIDLRGKWTPQIFRAFLFGIVIYGVYEMTNAAIIKNWTIDLVIIDTLWGGILYATIIATVLFLFGA